MNRITLWLIACCLLPLALQAQNLTTVSASGLYKGGVLLSSGQICFTGTDSNDNAIPFRVGGGGQEVTYPYCAVVTNGAISGTLQVANPANTAPANINYRVELFNQYNRIQKWAGVQFAGATFNFDNYVPSANLPLGTSTNVATIGNLTITGSCTGCGAGGGGGGYATLQNAGSALAQRATANFFSGITCADNSGQTRTDCQIDQSFTPTWTGAHTFNASVNLAGGLKINGAAAAGKIPIGDGSNFVPGDPLVQGLNAEGSTATNNPINIGGFDTAGTPAMHGTKVLNSAPGGTEYGIVTRPIPSGTQAISAVSLPLPSGAATSAKQPALGTAGSASSDVLTVQGIASMTALKVDGSAVTQPVSAASLPLPSGASTAAKQPALGTAGSASPDVITVQGIASMTALKVDGSGVTQPVSGTFWQATQPVSLADGSETTLGSKADAKSTSTDTTAVSVMQVLKEISAMEQAPASRAVTNAGTFAVQDSTTETNTTGLNSTVATPASATPPKAIQISGTDGTNAIVPYLDPCKRGAKTRFVINQTAGTQIITGTASKKTYICDLDIVTATAQNIALVEGTGSVCATGSGGMAGGTTAATGWNFAANSGLTKGNGDASVFSADSAAADNVCILQSGSGQISGSGHYVQY